MTCGRARRTPYLCTSLVSFIACACASTGAWGRACAAEARGRAPAPVEPRLVVLVAQEGLLATVAALCDVLGHARRRHARESRHGPSIPAPGRRCDSLAGCPPTYVRPFDIGLLPPALRGDHLFASVTPIPHVLSEKPLHKASALTRGAQPRTRGCGSCIACLTIVLKLVRCTEKRWRALSGSDLIPQVLEGVQFIDGVRKEAAGPFPRDTTSDNTSRLHAAFSYSRSVVCHTLLHLSPIHNTMNGLSIQWAVKVLPCLAGLVQVLLPA